MSKHNSNLLVVEDSDALRFLLGTILSKHYNVTTKCDGLEAMSWLSKGTIPSLIIIDLNMPRLGGVEFLLHLRNSGIYRDIPVIVLSANDDADERELLYNLGIVDFLEKPFNPTKLLNKVESALAIETV